MKKETTTNIKKVLGVFLLVLFGIIYIPIKIIIELIKDY